MSDSPINFKISDILRKKIESLIDSNCESYHLNTENDLRKYLFKDYFQDQNQADTIIQNLYQNNSVHVLYILQSFIVNKEYGEQIELSYSQSLNQEPLKYLFLSISDFKESDPLNSNYFQGCFPKFPISLEQKIGTYFTSNEMEHISDLNKKRIKSFTKI